MHREGLAAQGITPTISGGLRPRRQRCHDFGSRDLWAVVGLKPAPISPRQFSPLDFHDARGRQ